MSSAAVADVSAPARRRCGHATSEMSGSAEPLNCSTRCHLNHGSGFMKTPSSSAQPICPIIQRAAHVAMAPQNTAWRPIHRLRLRAITTSGAIGGSSSAMSPMITRTWG